MKLYLDLCCVNRPFDDQTQPRVSLESQAVILILESVDNDRHSLCSSTALVTENDQTPDAERRAKVAAILSRASEWIPHSRGLDQRVAQLLPLGFRAFDAYHVAAAESAQCDRLVTCDDQFLRAGRRNSGRIAVQVTDAISLVSETGF